jgi:hypothetical protein
VPEHRGERRAHALQGRVALHDVVQRLVRAVHGLFEHADDLVRRHVGVE